MSRRFIDMHQHLWDIEGAEAMAAEYERLGAARAALMGLPDNRVPGNSETVLEAAKRFPDLFVPFAGPDMDAATQEDITRYCDQGFTGIKFIAPQRPYNDRAYWPLYQMASDLGMPVLFHLGIVANKPAWADVNSNNMRPIHLDHIARNHPNLTIIGAHLGNPWFDEATMACRWNSNLFFDISGSTLKKKTPQFVGERLWWTPETAYKSPDSSHAWTKIVFGSDVATESIEDVVNDYENLMSTLGLSDELQEAVWCGTAARILKLEDI